MSGGGIFLVGPDDRLVEMCSAAYESEEILQVLLARYPSLLAGEQVDPGAPRRWLLVAREAGIPDQIAGSDRWSVDHLLLDQDAIPTLVEVKRSSDTRIRREVVGQMLDYAANAVAYWPVERLQTAFEATCAKTNALPDDVLTQFLGADRETAEFWQAAKTNLQAGRLRLVFVADEIPPELRRVVEFLNEQMDPAEVLAVEIRQYVADTTRALVPRVLGQTAEALGRKTAGGHSERRWDRACFMKDLGERVGPHAVQAAAHVLQWAESRRLSIWWGKGASSGSFFPVAEVGAESHTLVACWTHGKLEFQFERMMTRKAFADEEIRSEWLRRLGEALGVTLPADSISRRPSVPLADVAAKGRWDALVPALDWALDRIRTLSDS